MRIPSHTFAACVQGHVFGIQPFQAMGMRWRPKQDPNGDELVRQTSEEAGRETRTLHTFNHVLDTGHKHK